MTAEQFTESFRRRFWTTSSFYSGLALMVLDLFGIMLCLGAGFFIVNLIDFSIINFKSFVTYWIYLPAFIIVFYFAKLYPGIMNSPADEIRRFAVCSLCCYAGIALSITVETDFQAPISIALILAIPVSCFLMPFGRELGRKLFSKFRWWGIPAVIYMHSRQGQNIVDRLLNNPDLGYRPVLIITDGNGAGSEYRGVPIFSNTPEIQEAIRSLNIKTAVITETAPEDTRTETFLSESSIMMLYRYTITIPYHPSIASIFITVRDFGGMLGFCTTHNLTKRGNVFIKRLIDLFLCFILAPAAILLAAAVAAGIKLTSPGPVFYGHSRVGKNGTPFKVWKFRSMVTDADERLKHILETDPKRKAEWEKDRKLTDDPRITPFGHFIRKTSLDELPQLWNILTGRMSFIGPRPVTESELEKYGDKAPYILSVKPGLSGMWQISGRSDTGYEDRVVLDSYYIQNWSIWLDIWIIIKTIWVVLRGRGAY